MTTKLTTTNQVIISALDQIKELKYRLNDLTLYDLLISVVSTFKLLEKIVGFRQC